MSQGDRCEFRIRRESRGEQPTDGREAVEKATEVVCIQRVTPIPEQRPRRLGGARASAVAARQGQGDLAAVVGRRRPLLLDACGCGAHAALLEKAQIDDDILFDTITFEDLQAAGLPSLAHEEADCSFRTAQGTIKVSGTQLPSIIKRQSSTSGEGGGAGWSQVAKPVVPEAVVPEALPEEPPVIIEAPAPAPILAAREAEEAARQEEATAAPRPSLQAPETPVHQYSEPVSPSFQLQLDIDEAAASARRRQEVVGGVVIER